jgi:TolA-binding protein
MKKRFVILSIGLLSVCGMLAVRSVPVRASAGDAVAAQKKLVIDSIVNNDMAAAEAACWQLVSQPTPHALHEIVDEAKATGTLSQVRQVFQDMIAARPNDPDVIWLKTGLAIADVHLSDDTAVQVILQDIIARHGSDDRAAEAFTQIAWAYCKLEQRAMALPIYQYTVDAWPQKSRVAYAQQSIATCQIKLGDFAAANKAFDAFVEKFANDADASKLILWTGFCYEDAGQKDKAYDVYGLVVQKYPDTPEAVTAQTRRALASVEAEDPNRMDQDIQTLLTQFAAAQDKAASLHSLADILFWKHVAYAYKPARQSILALIDVYLGEIANYTLATWPQSDWTLWSQRDLAALAVRRGDDSAAEEALQKMLSDHGGDAKLPEAVFEVGEQYWMMAGDERGKSLGGLVKGQTIVIVGPLPALPEKAKAAYSNAKRIWKRIADDLPISSTTPQAVFFFAECCRALGEDQDAMAAYQEVIDLWPDYEYAWMAQDRIVKGYRDMARLGSMSVYDSEVAIAAAYGQMLKLFPNCPAASRASEWLKGRQGKSETQLRQEAAKRQQLMKMVRGNANKGGSK